MTLSTESRLRGAVYGLLIGDALGVPYEFFGSNDLPTPEMLEMSAPAGFPRSHAGVPPGTWSDDGAQALTLLKTLLDGDQDLETRLACGLQSWLVAGHMTPDGKVFDIGVQTRRALARFDRGIPASRSGPTDERSNGNGSLMRCLPAALVPAQDDVSYISRARRQSMTTHGHAKSLLACSMSTIIGTRLLAGERFVQALENARGVMEASTSPSEHAELRSLLDGRLNPPRGTGFVEDCFWTAVASVLQTSTFEDSVKTAIGYGNDTDTTACVAGGWAGLIYGEEAIPQRWRTQLRGKHLVEPLLDRLAQLHRPVAASVEAHPNWVGRLAAQGKRLLSRIS